MARTLPGNRCRTTPVAAPSAKQLHGLAPFVHLPGRSSVSAEVVIAVAVAVATALPALVVVLRHWLFGRWLQPHRMVRLELDGETIELRGITSEEQAKLIEAWLERQDLDKGGEESGDR